MTFQATDGMRVSLRINPYAGFSAGISDSSGHTIASCQLGCNGGSNFIEPTSPLAAGETYTVWYWAQLSGNATLTLYNVPPDFTGSTTPVSGSGGAVPFTITTPGQNAYITFQGYEGERLSWAQSGSAAAYSTTLIDPLGAVIASCGYNCNGGSRFLEPVILHPPPGLFLYKVFFNPSYTYTGSFTVTLYDVPGDLSIAVTPTSAATAVPLTIGTPGQNARITFPGSNGQLLGWTQSGSLAAYQTDLYDPNGAWVTSCGYNCNGGSGTLNPTTLATTGTYTVFFNPFYAYTGSKTITLTLTPGFSAVIYGQANVGQVLLAAAEGLQPPPTTPLTYQWERCNTVGASCSDLFGQTSSTHTIDQTDVGTTLRVRISAANATGTTTVESKATPIIVLDFNTLALRYRPVLLFHKGDPVQRTNERWRPLDIPTFLQEQDANYFFDHVVCDDPEGGASCHPLGSASVLTAHWLEDAHIDIRDDALSYYRPSASNCPGFAPIDNDSVGRIEDCDAGPTSVIYYEPGQDGASYRYLDYWWFLRYNDTSDVPDAFGADAHVGDWEGVTVVLDPLNDAANPTVQYVLYAAHDQSVWVGVNAVPKTGERPDVWSAHGTHASYQFPCPADCHQPEGSSFSHEAPHDGEAPWGNNDDGNCNDQCVQRFPDSDSSWTFWPGRWGPSRGDPTQTISWSPQSPGVKSRFLCARNGRSDGTCDRPPGSRSPLSLKAHGAPPANAHTCRGWFGFGIAAVACDQKALNAALRMHRFARHWTLHLRAKGRQSGDSPGLAQVLGEPLVPGEAITVTGTASARTILLLQVRVGQHRYVLRIRYLAIRPKRGVRVLHLAFRGGKPTIRIGRRFIQASLTR
jgi:hypothetical protein